MHFSNDSREPLVRPAGGFGYSRFSVGVYPEITEK